MGHMMGHITRNELYRLMRERGIDWMTTELIGGRLIDPPREGNNHWATVDVLRRLLGNVFGEGYWVRMRGTLDLSEDCVVDTDLAVIEGDLRAPADENPGWALLVVEVSERSLDFDRNAKASMYAAAGIADYWIVNMQDRQLEIRRDPQPDATQEFGHGYASLVTLKPGDTASPLAAPTGRVPVDRMFF